jgi:hypothetical protein
VLADLWQIHRVVNRSNCEMKRRGSTLMGTAIGNFARPLVPASPPPLPQKCRWQRGEAVPEEEVWSLAKDFREAHPWTTEGPRQVVSEMHFAVSTIRFAYQALNNWSKMWNRPPDKHSAYCDLLANAICAFEWITGQNANGVGETDQVVSFYEACWLSDSNPEILCDRILSTIDPVALMWLKFAAPLFDIAMGENERASCEEPPLKGKGRSAGRKKALAREAAS